jgi:hypothetical protein
VNRTDFVAALAAATVAPAASPANGVAPAASSGVTAEIEIKRDATELLAPFTVAIAVRNPTSHLVSLDFPTADIYRIDVRHDDQTVWSTTTRHKPLLIARRVDVLPGLTRLASQIVDGTTDDRRAYEPGQYVVHVALLGTTLTTTIDKAIAFNPPISIADALRTTGGTVVTIAGVPRIDVGVFELRDATGSLRLSRPLGLRPTGNYVVRGYLDAVGDDVEFAVGRFAPAFDNVIDARPKVPT